jgi:hypothetical protein
VLLESKELVEELDEKSSQPIVTEELRIDVPSQVTLPDKPLLFF